MKHKGFCCLIMGIIISLSCNDVGKVATPDYPTRPVAFTEVHFNDMFWAPRLETNRTVTIPYALEQCVETGRIKNFEEAAKVLKGEMEKGSFCSTYPFDDSDLFKILEGASYALLIKADPVLETRVDDLISKIAAAQEEDG